MCHARLVGESFEAWERHAGWWQEGFTDGADAEYEEQILPMAVDLLAGCLCRDLFLETEPGVDPDVRADGRDWPFSAETMIGRRRLDNLIECLTTVLDDGIPGDLIETGVWRGGATILMRGALAAWEDEARSVWVADSFRGLPTPDGATWPADQGVDLSDIDALAVPRSVVEANFERYGLLDERVHLSLIHI